MILSNVLLRNMAILKKKNTNYYSRSKVSHKYVSGEDVPVLNFKNDGCHSLETNQYFDFQLLF